MALFKFMPAYHIEKIFLKLFIFISIAYDYGQPRRLFGEMKTLLVIIPSLWPIEVCSEMSLSLDDMARWRYNRYRAGWGFIRSNGSKDDGGGCIFTDHFLPQSEAPCPPRQDGACTLGFPGKVISFYIVPPVVGSYRLDPAYPALAGRGTFRPIF